MCKIILSPRQKEIVNYLNGPLLVMASAGSGKTRVLTERIANLTKHTRRRILAITFTNKACEEIKTRLQQKDYDMMEQVLVSTFHGFCTQVLESHVAAMNWHSMPQIFRDEDIRQVVASAICDSPNLREKYLSLDNRGRYLMVSSAIDAISQIKREVILDDELDEKVANNDYIEIYRIYCDYMESLHAIDFDDLLLDTYRLFLYNPKVASLYRREFEYICVDEAQDMNKAQYQLLRILTGDEHRNIMLVGDAKQSIYAFNGSSSRFMQKDFVNDYSPVTIMNLQENYRSAKSILDYARLIIHDAPIEEFVKLQGVCQEITYNTPCDEAQGVVDSINKMLLDEHVKDVGRRLTYADFSVLARNKFVLSKIEAELIKAGIPYHYKNTSGNPEFTSTSANIFSLAMMIRLNEMDNLHLGQLKKLMGIPEAESIVDLAKATDKDFYKLILESVSALNLDGSNFRPTLKKLASYIKEQSQNMQLDQQEWLVAYDDFKEINKHWTKYASSVNTTSLTAIRNAMTLGQTATIKQEDSVSLATVHTMKGQQSTIVFLIGMDEGTFPDYRAVKLGTKSAEMQQERNNLYVAVTRAQRHLYISYPKKRLMPWGDWSIRNRSSLLPKCI